MCWLDICAPSLIHQAVLTTPAAFKLPPVCTLYCRHEFALSTQSHYYIIESFHATAGSHYLLELYTLVGVVAVRAVFQVLSRGMPLKPNDYDSAADPNY